MDYFKDAIKFIKENKLKSSIIFLLDIAVYALFIPIFSLFGSLFFRQINKMPIQTMGAVMQSMEMESLQALQTKLVSIFIGIIGTVLLLFLLILLDIAVVKGIIWLMTLKKKIDYKLLVKSILLTLVLALLFLIPFILSLFPFFMQIKNYNAAAPIIDAQFVDFIPLIIVSFIMVYIFTLAFYFLAKEGSFRKAFKNCFKTGVMKSSKLIMPFIAFFAINAAVIKLMRNAGAMFTWGMIVVIVFIVGMSFLNRIWLSKSA